MKRIAVVHFVGGGGAKRALYEQVRGLLQRGYEISVFSPEPTPNEYLPLTSLGVPVIYSQTPATDSLALPDGNTAESTARRVFRQLFGQAVFEMVRDSVWVQRQEQTIQKRLQQYREIGKAVQQFAPDRVLVHQCQTLLAPETLFDELAGMGVVFYLQDTLRRACEWGITTEPHFDTTPERFLRQKGLGTVTSPVLAKFREQERRRYVAGVRKAGTIGTVLVNSYFSRESLLRTTGVAAQVCYLGIDTAFFCPAPEIARTDKILSVGALRPEKRHDLIVEALSHVPEEIRPSLQLIGYEMSVAGEPGPVTRHLQHQAKERNISLILESDTTDKALLHAYQTAKMMVFAPYLEPFGLTPLEAMACQTPVVGIAEGGLRETIRHGETGLLADPTPTDLGNAITHLLQHPMERERLAEQAYTAVCQNWSVEAANDRLETVLCRESPGYRGGTR